MKRFLCILGIWVCIFALIAIIFSVFYAVIDATSNSGQDKNLVTVVLADGHTFTNVLSKGSGKYFINDKKVYFRNVSYIIEE